MHPDTVLQSLRRLKGTPVFLDESRSGRLRRLLLDPRNLDVSHVIGKAHGEADSSIPTSRIRQTWGEGRTLAIATEPDPPHTPDATSTLQTASTPDTTAGERRRLFARHLIGCRVVAGSGSCGTVTDVVIDTERWSIRYVTVRKHPWLFWKKTLLPPLWIHTLDPAARTIAVRLTRHAVQQAPEIRSHSVIDPGFEKKLIYHYGSDRYRMPTDTLT